MYSYDSFKLLRHLLIKGQIQKRKRKLIGKNWSEIEYNNFALNTPKIY